MINSAKHFGMVIPVLALILLAACDRAAVAPAAEAGGLSPVLVEQAKRGPFRIERKYTGTVRAAGEVPVAVREPGTVLAVSFPNEGAPVAAGQELLRLESPELELSIQQTQFLFEQAKGALERYETLKSQGLVPILEYEEQRNLYEATRVSLEQLKLRKAHLTVLAPARGVAAFERTPVPGQYLGAGTEVMRLLDTKSLVVEVAMPVAGGGAGEIKGALLELSDGTEVRAESAGVASEVDPKRGGRILRLRPEPGAAMLHGETLGVKLILVSREDAVTVPLGALTKTDEGYQVILGPAPGEKGRARPAKVVRGPDDGERAVIESGLEGGAWVVVGPVSSDAGYYGTMLGVGR